MDPHTLDPVVLSGIVKLIGVVVSWGLTIFALWVRKPPPLLSEHPFFTQVRLIATLLVSIFLVLTWGLMGNTQSAPSLVWISIVATGLGIVVFFWTAHAVSHARPDRNRSPSIWPLVGFMFYVTTISWGLTAAVEFLAVLLLNPTNPTSSSVVASPKNYVASIQVSGEVELTKDQQQPFRSSSGQRNVGCEGTADASVQYLLPPGATMLGEPKATWENTSNLAAAAIARVGYEEPSRTVFAQGSIRGLNYQRFPLGITNCPGGGHGELVVQGVYKSPVTERVPRAIELNSTVAADNTTPTLLTLPSFKIGEINVAFTLAGQPEPALARLSVTPGSPNAESSDSRFKVILLVEKGQLALSAAR